MGAATAALDLDGDGIVTFADLRILYEHIPAEERDFGGVSTLWVLDYMEPTDPSVEGLDPRVDQSQLDSDGDARTTYEEFVAGTDPTDPTSLFAVTSVTGSIAPDGELFTVTWTVAAGKQYQLYASETIAPGADWQPVFGDYMIDAGTASQTVVVDTETKQLFFKVEVW